MTSVLFNGLVLTAVIFALPLAAHAETWMATSTSSMAITGDVTITEDTLSFANGAGIAIRAAASDRVFAVDPPADPILLNGNKLCGGGDPVTYIVLGRPDPNSLYLKVFNGRDMPAASDALQQPGMCASYNFERAADDSAANTSASISPEDVAEIQQLLNELGYAAGPVDGQAGRRTRSAIRSFQQAVGIPVTGRLDAALLNTLRTELSQRATSRATTDDAQLLTAAKAELHARIESEIFNFCKTVHNSVPSIPVSTIETTDEGSGEYPDLVFKYKYIGCAGVEKPALAQCGFCGLTMEGMKCAVKTFAFRSGRYEEVSQKLEGIFD